MRRRNGFQIQWTTDNFPSSIGSATGSSTFNYGPDHARYYQAATFNGVSTDTTYIGGLFEVVASSTGTTEYRHNIMADGQVVAVHTIDQSGSTGTDYLHYDHLGSVDAITGNNGQVIQSMSFSAFGQRRIASDWDYGVSQDTLATLKDYTDRGYTDQEELDNVSLVDLNGRVYDPTVGRVISADPTISQPFFSQGFNRYAYVLNNPLTFTDPSGFACKDGNALYSKNGCYQDPSDIPLLPVNVSSPYFPIGDNTNEPGSTNLSNCNCVQSGPSNSGNQDSGSSTVNLGPVNVNAQKPITPVPAGPGPSLSLPQITNIIYRAPRIIPIFNFVDVPR